MAEISEFETEPEYDGREIVVRYMNAKGESRIHGGSALKGSQSYPKKFGQALAKVRSKHQKRNHRKAMAWLAKASRTTIVAHASTKRGLLAQTCSQC